MRTGIIKWLVPILLSSVLFSIGVSAYSSQTVVTSVPVRPRTATDVPQADADTDIELQAQQLPDSDLDGIDIETDILAQDSSDMEQDGQDSLDAVHDPADIGQAADDPVNQEVSGQENESAESVIEVELISEGDDQTQDSQQESDGDSAWMGSPDAVQRQDMARDDSEDSMGTDASGAGDSDMEMSEDPGGLRQGECGKIEGTAYWGISNDGILTIYGEGEMQDYVLPARAPWSIFSTEITAVVIEDGITSIGDYAFSSLNLFSGIQIPDSVKYIGTNAFSDCAGLKEVIIGKGGE